MKLTLRQKDDGMVLLVFSRTSKSAGGYNIVIGVDTWRVFEAFV